MGNGDGFGGCVGNWFGFRFGIGIGLAGIVGWFSWVVVVVCGDLVGFELPSCGWVVWALVTAYRWLVSWWAWLGFGFSWVFLGWGVGLVSLVVLQPGLGGCGRHWFGFRGWFDLLGLGVGPVAFGFRLGLGLGLVVGSGVVVLVKVFRVLVLGLGSGSGFVVGLSFSLIVRFGSCLLKTLFIRF